MAVPSTAYRPSMGQHNRGRIGISQSVRRLVRRGIVRGCPIDGLRRLVRRGIVRGCPIDGLGRRWDSIIEVEYGLVWIDVWNCNVLQ